MELLKAVAHSSYLLGVSIADLESAQLDPSLSADQRSAISLALPRLRTRKSELEAEFAALSALVQAMQLPPADAQEAIKSASEALARQTAQAMQAELLLTTVTNLVNAIRSAKPA